MTETAKSMPTRPRRVRNITQWDIETDVAIVGFGGAGACAAIEASDAGADVCIFEVSAASGGSTAAMLERLDSQLSGRLTELDARIDELQQLRGEMSRYREHVYGRRKKLAEGSE